MQNNLARSGPAFMLHKQPREGSVIAHSIDGARVHLQKRGEAQAGAVAYFRPAEWCTWAAADGSGLRAGGGLSRSIWGPASTTAVWSLGAWSDDAAAQRLCVAEVIEWDRRRGSARPGGRSWTYAYRWGQRNQRTRPLLA
ncbi:hypothetical protein NDU88_001791 [Pleurodeles waltl]|uniref:Uncharacterized protein n=1 Tax=Pleurodeles waltl TaxID=8319 RepID=A0AAV7T0G2_PLEWA|nr:hypothetical protein NDU88_001791 [Pleurodeles waltl]